MALRRKGKTMAKRQAEIGPLAEGIVKVLGPHSAFIVLFGSAAQGRLTADSDVDVAYLPREIRAAAAGVTGYLDRVAELGESVGRQVDLIDLSRSDPIVNWQVIKTGVVIWGRESRAWAEFRLRVPTQYEDFKRERAAVEESLARRGIGGQG